MESVTARPEARPERPERPERPAGGVAGGVAECKGAEGAAEGAAENLLAEDDGVAGGEAECKGAEGPAEGLMAEEEDGGVAECKGVAAEEETEAGLKNLPWATIESLFQSGRVLIPRAEWPRIRSVYGGMDFKDFDTKYDANKAFGGHDGWVCIQTMMQRMNEMHEMAQREGCCPGRLTSKEFQKLHTQELRDVFNILHSAVRTRVGESLVWFT